MHRFAAALGSLAIATFFAAPAHAQCIPGTALCASAGVSTPPIQVGGQISVGLPQLSVQVPIPAAPSAPPPAAQPPAPRYYAPAPPPPVRYAVPRDPGYGSSKLGLDLRIEGAGGFSKGQQRDVYGLGGGGVGLRYRLAPHFGVEAGVDLLGGHDYNDRKRLEVVGSAGGLFFINPRSRLQLYLSGGMLVDHARASSTYDAAYLAPTQTFTHVGGYAGLGLEYFISRRIALHGDVRGIVRQKVGGNSDAPEFMELGTGRSTNTSGALVGSAGIAFYF
jgi:hypothetical protein